MAFTIGRYQIEEEIGSGGFATVYRAHDPVLERDVAVKVMRPLLMSEPGFVTRFEREAKTAAQLQHPAIVPIYDYGEHQGRLYLVMKLMPLSLAGRLARGALPWTHTVDVVNHLAAGLDFAHRRDVVHRDIKPDNILLEDATGTAALGDFGIVKALGQSTLTMSMSGGILGTPAYLAPEIWNGQEATAASDIYALACVIFEMVTGRQLFEGPTPPAIMTLHFRRPQFPEAWPEGTPAGLPAALDRALARQPAARFASAGALAAALAGLQEADPLAELYDSLTRAVAARRWEDAARLAEDILAQAPGYRDVADLLATVMEAQAAAGRQAWIAQWQEQAEAAQAAGEWATAQAAAEQWLRLAPEDVAAQEAVARARDGLARPETDTASPAAKDVAGAIPATSATPPLGSGDAPLVPPAAPADTSRPDGQATGVAADRSKRIAHWRAQAVEALAAGQWAAAQAAAEQWLRLAPQADEARAAVIQAKDAQWREAAEIRQEPAETAAVPDEVTTTADRRGAAAPSGPQPAVGEPVRHAGPPPTPIILQPTAGTGWRWVLIEGIGLIILGAIHWQVSIYPFWAVTILALIWLIVGIAWVANHFSKRSGPAT